MRIFQSGAELRSINELNPQFNSGHLESSSSNWYDLRGYGGNRAWRMTASDFSWTSRLEYFSVDVARADNLTAAYYKANVLIENLTEVSGSRRVFVRPMTISGSNTIADIRFYNSSEGVRCIVHYNNNASTSEDIITNVQIGSSSWFRLEAFVDITSGDFELRIDGETIISENVGFTASYLSDWMIMASAESMGGSLRIVGFYVDDLAVNTPDGTHNNSWVGEEVIQVLMPNAAGTPTPTSGTYASVSGNPVAIGSYITRSVGSAFFNIQDISGPSASVVNAVSMLYYMGSNGGTSTMRAAIKSSSGGTPELGPSLSDSNVGEYRYRQTLFSETDPTTGLPWTLTGINSAQIGIDVTSGTARAQQMSAQVAWTPAEPTGSGMLYMFW